MSNTWKCICETKVTSVIYLIGFVVYSLLSESDTQSWALNSSEEKKEKLDDKMHT
jgi:hypothetical protein